MIESTTIFLIINMLNGTSYFLISPLIPTLGEKNDFSESVLGWIIGIFPLTESIFSTIVPILSKKFSRVKLLCFGTFFAATITILYGILIFIPNRNLLMIICFSLRIFHGFCAAIITTLIYSLTISFAAKEKTQSSLGKLEIAFAIGNSLGTVIASVFYKIGGYPLPFFVTGILLFSSFYLSSQINDKNIKKDDDDDEEKTDNNINYLKYLFYPEIYSILIGFVISMIGLTFYFPSLTYHLTNNYSVSVSTASLFFIVPKIPNMISLQFLDKISAKLGIYLTFTVALLLTGISPFFIYPISPLPRSLIVIIIGFFLMGSGDTPAFISGLVMLSKNIKGIDKSIDEMSANDISSVLANIGVELGDFIGPIIGGYLTDNLGFKMCCFIIALIGLAYSTLIFLFYNSNIRNDLNKAVCQKEKSENNKDKNEKDKINHLKNN